MVLKYTTTTFPCVSLLIVVLWPEGMSQEWFQSIQRRHVPCISLLIIVLWPEGMSQEWFHRIMALVPKKLQKNQREIKRINEEIKEDYAFAVKKSVVDFVLKEPEIDEDERFLGK